MKFFVNVHKKVKEHIQEQMENLKRATQQQKEVAAPKAKEEVSETIYFDIKVGTVLKVMVTILLVLGLVGIFKKIDTILLMLFISMIFAAAMTPMVDWAERKRVPRALSILIIYILFVGFIGTMASSFIPILIEQVSSLVVYLTDLTQTIKTDGLIEGIPFADRIEPILKKFAIDIDQTKLLDQFSASVQSLTSNLGKVAGNAVQAALSLFGGILQFFLVLFFTFFMVIDTKGFEKFAISLIPSRFHEYIITQGGKIQQKLGAWLRGQVLLSLIVGLLVYIGLTIIGVEYAFTFALVAALLEFIPVIGPLLTAIVTIPIILTQSLLIALIALIFFVALNWVESNVLVPLIMNKAIGLNPLVIVVAMLIGSALLGPIGIVIAIPIAAAIKVLIEEYAEREK